MSGGLALALMVALGGAGWVPGVATAEGMQPKDAHKVKVAFLFNFAKYVHWSDRVEGLPMVLCVAGETPLRETLVLLRGREVGGVPIEVRELPEGRSPGECRMLFVAESARHRAAALLDPERGGDTLTVSDTPRFLEQGGMIQLFMEGERVRFGVNLDALRASRLSVSSRLLRLARRRIEGGEERR